MIRMPTSVRLKAKVVIVAMALKVMPMPLKDSGVAEVVVALRAGSSTIAKAEGAGFKVMTVIDAALGLRCDE